MAAARRCAERELFSADTPDPVFAWQGFHKLRWGYTPRCATRFDICPTCPMPARAAAGLVGVVFFGGVSRASFFLGWFFWFWSCWRWLSSRCWFGVGWWLLFLVFASFLSFVLDKYCPGWTWEIKETLISRDQAEPASEADRIFIVGRLTIPTSEGNIYREASGTEELKRQAYDKKIGRYTEKEIAYGDPSSNAESMAFRRCAARFGLGLYLYQK